MLHEDMKGINQNAQEKRESQHKTMKISEEKPFFWQQNLFGEYKENKESKNELRFTILQK